MKTKKTRFLWAAGVLAIVALVSCDIGNWDITHGAASVRNFAAFEEIDFLTGEILSGPRTGSFVEGRESLTDVRGNEQVVGRAAYPLVFGTSSNNRGSAILGGGKRSMRFQNEAFARSVATGANPQPPAPWNQAEPWIELPLPDTSPHRGSIHFPGNVVPERVPPGFIEIAATRSGQGGGKIAGSEDGISFLFREVPLGRNFRMSADFLIVSYGNLGTGRAALPHNPGSNGQEGFGIMVRDFVPQIGPEGSGPFTAALDIVPLPGRMGGGTFVPGTTMPDWDRNHRWRFETDAEGNLLSGMTHEMALDDATIGVPGAGSHPDNASFHYFVGAAGFGADSNMIMAGGTKRGMRVKWRAGILPGAPQRGECGNPIEPGTQNSGRFNFAYFPRMLGDYSPFTDTIRGENVPTMAARPDFPRWGSTVRVTLEKTNDGFRYRVENLDDTFRDTVDLETGALRPDHQVVERPKFVVDSAEWGVIPHNNILGMVNDRHFYVGLFASRDAVVWAHNIRYWEAYSRYTTPETPFTPTPFEPEFEVVSPRYYGGVNYLYIQANTRGGVSVVQDGRPIPGRLITGEWIVETQNGIAVPRSLFIVPIFPPNEGDNIFGITFQPDGSTPRELEVQGLVQSSAASIRRNFNLVKRTFHGGTPGSHIYVAPSPGRPAFAGRPAIPCGFRVDERGRPLPGAPLGGPEGLGTRDSPLDLQTAINHVMPGQHIVMLNGRYVMGERLVIPRHNNGRQGYMKVLRAETVNGVWLDWNKNELIAGELGGEAFHLLGSFWHLDGFHVRGAPDRVKGMVISGNNNLLTRMMFYNNGDTGLQISGRAAEPVRFWPRDNVVKWTESFHNIDRAQTNADGFGAKLTVGPRNRFYSAIAHHNNDDGWDLFAKRDTGATGAVFIDYSIAYRQGNMLNNFTTIAGHNGFKMGGEGVGIFHEIRQSLAFANGEVLNRGWQITSNSNPNLMVRDTTTVHHDGIGAGNIEIRPGGTGIASGNALRSVASVVLRAGGQPSAFATSGTPRPPSGETDFGDVRFAWSEIGVPTDWRSQMTNFGPLFWGEGYAIGEANGADGTGQWQPASPYSMPACYSGWYIFAYFLPRDEWFAYPVLGDLYRPPMFDEDGNASPFTAAAYRAGEYRAFGATGLYDRCRLASEAMVRRYIPWALDGRQPVPPLR